MKAMRVWAGLGAFLGSQGAFSQEQILTLPGTGISIVPPSGTELAKVGTTLFDSSGELTMQFITMDAKFDPDKDPLWSGLYRSKAEKVGHLPRGRLRSRTRKVDGGQFDGLMLTAVRDGVALQVIVSYKGNAPGEIEKLRTHLLTVTWDPAIADPEKAAGVDFDFEGLRPAGRQFPGITYTASGREDDQGTSVVVMPMPSIPAQEKALSPANCDSVLSAGMLGVPHTAVLMQTAPTHSYCESWSDPVNAEGKYIALVKLKSGGMLTLWGTAPPADFASALPMFRRGVERMTILRTP